MRAILISFLLGAAMQVPLITTADPTVPVPKHQRMSIIDDNVYESSVLAGPKLTKRFKFTMKTKNRKVSDGETTKTEERNRFEILSYDARVIRSRMHWSNNTSSGSATNHETLNGMLGLRNQGDASGEKPSVTRLLSAYGGLWPLKEGASARIVTHMKPDWTTTEYTIKSEFEVTGRFPANTIHKKLTGDAYRITERSKWRIRVTDELSSNNVTNYALIEDLGYAFYLDNDYKSADGTYDSYSSYKIEDLEFLD